MTTQPRRLSRRAAALAAIASAALFVASAGAAPTASRVTPVPTYRGRAPALEFSARAPAVRFSSGLTAQQIRAAYGLPATGASKILAAVVPFDDPAAASDLAKYSSVLGLKPCTTGNHCFRKVNETGTASPLPGPDDTGGTWTTEAALSTQLLHGICGNCKVLLVEASSDSEVDVSAAVATAMRMAPIVVTMFTPAEQQNDLFYESKYSNPHSIVVSATGDTGFVGGTNFPSSFPSVLAVGGTQLKKLSHGRYGREAAWNDANGSTTSGCSTDTSAAAWQKPFAAAMGCGSARATADISAVASPGADIFISGIASSGWNEIGGTSMSAPIVAGAIGLGGGGGPATVKRLYARAHTTPLSLRDITSGATFGCTGGPICTARHGYDGPTGLGTPYGLAAFMPSGGALAARHPRLGAVVPHPRLSISGNWRTSIRIQNQNPFAVEGSVRILVHGRVVASSRKVIVAPLATARETIEISKSARALLKRLGGGTARLELRGFHGPAGHSLSTTEAVRLVVR